MGRLWQCCWLGIALLAAAVSAAQTAAAADDEDARFCQHVVGHVIERSWAVTPAYIEAWPAGDDGVLITWRHSEESKLVTAACYFNAGADLASKLRSVVVDRVEADRALVNEAVRIWAERAGLTIPETGGWAVRSEISPIDDSTNVMLRLESDEEVYGSFGSSRPSLHLQCRENRTDAYVYWGTYVDNEAVAVLTRFDSEKATEQRWSISTDRNATFAPKPIAFIRKLLEHERFLAQVTPYGKSPVLTTFTLNGLAEAVKPLVEACHWTPSQ